MNQPAPINDDLAFTSLSHSPPHVGVPHTLVPLAARGHCIRCDREHQLFRTQQAESIAQRLMEALRQQKNIDLHQPNPEKRVTQLNTQCLHQEQGGKMFGVLLCQNANGDTGYIKAFSGLFNRISHVRGWAPPVSDLCDTAAHQEKVENQVGLLTNEVDNLNDALATLRNQQESITCTFEPLIDAQMHQNRRRRAKRKQQRELITDHDRPQRLNQLSHESQEDQDALRAIRSAHREAIHPITEKVTALEEQLLQLKRSRRDVSAQLNHTLQSACVLHNFTGTAKPLMEVFLNKGVPTGAGDCCAPKLLHYAATHGLTPLGLAEFWLGAPKSQGRVDGHFYPACEEKCTPLLGFMLCGLPTAEASS